jgi:hypothetical protein
MVDGEIRKCRFCGIHTEFDVQDIGDDSYRAVCKTCGTRGPLVGSAGGCGGCRDRAGESPAKLTGVSIGMVIRYRLQARRVCVPHLPGSIPGRPKVRNVGSNPAKEITLFIVQW